jgi:K+-sensing histidine kinase KdpD
MLACLFEHAILSTPQGKPVIVKVERTQDHSARLRVIDGGPAVPRQAREDLLRNTTDPSALGRPGGISLLVAYLAAGRLSLSLLMGETEDGRTCVDALLPLD